MNPFQYVRVRYFLIVFMLFSIFDHMSVIFFEQTLHNSAQFSYYIKTICFYVFPALWLWYELRHHSVPLAFFINRKGQYKPLQVIGITGALLIFSYGFFVVLLYASSWFTPDLMESPIIKVSTWVERLTESSMGMWEFIVIVLLAPVVEELLFRGFLFQRFAAKWGTEKGIFIVALLFGGFYADLIGAFAVSIVLSLVYIRTKSLFMAINIHFLYNLTLFMTFHVFYESGEAALKSMQGSTMFTTGVLSFMIGLNFILIFWFTNRRYVEKGIPALYVNKVS